MTVFLLFGIVLFFGLLLIYPFQIIFLSGFIYLSFIPISFLHYRKINKQKNINKIKNDDDEPEDML
jgi:CDP-diacylglycerol--serine O-phosphatidyltransferase